MVFLGADNSYKSWLISKMPTFIYSCSLFILLPGTCLLTAPSARREKAQRRINALNLGEL